MLRTGVQAKKCGGFEEGGSGTGDRCACHDVGFMAGGMAGVEDEGGYMARRWALPPVTLWAFISLLPMPKR